MGEGETGGGRERESESESESQRERERERARAHMCIYTRTDVYGHTFASIYTCTHAYKQVRTKGMHAHVRACVCVCMYMPRRVSCACMLACMYVCTGIYRHTYARA